MLKLSLKGGLSEEHPMVLTAHGTKHFDSQALLIWSHLSLQVLICQQHRTFPVRGIRVIQTRLQMLLILFLPAGVLKFNSAFYKTSERANMVEWCENDCCHVLMREKNTT